MWGKLILATSKARESARLTLVALGETAGKKGVACAPVPTLAAWVGVSERQIQRDLKTLQALGEIELAEAGGGRGKPAKYRILLQWTREARFWPQKAGWKRVTLTKGV